jgi:heme/copper-type cytochrome/quinol oxidase subunit 2
MDHGQFNVYHALAAIAFVVATGVMFAGVGTSFLPSSNRAEANEVWMYFFSTWALALVIVFLTRALIVRARRIGRRKRRAGRRNDVALAADVAVAAQALIWIGFLLWGLSARLQGC